MAPRKWEWSRLSPSSAISRPVEIQNTTWINAFDSSNVTLSAGVVLGNYEYRVLLK
jgi:hypothetical protein